eukprot:scaffold1616_cov310-Pinguiococcus_pyrenoidosus.AAC.16
MSVIEGSGWKVGCEWYQPTTSKPASSIARVCSIWLAGSISTSVVPSSHRSLDRHGNAPCTYKYPRSSSHFPPRSPMISASLSCACRSATKHACGWTTTDNFLGTCRTPPSGARGECPRATTSLSVRSPA